MQASLALWRGVPPRCVVPAPESATRSIRYARKVPPIGGSRNCPNRAEAQPGRELGSFQPAISPRLPKAVIACGCSPSARMEKASLSPPGCAGCSAAGCACWVMRCKLEPGDPPPPLRARTNRVARCSWRGSNPRPWAHKTHALTTRPQERIHSLGSGG